MGLDSYVGFLHRDRPGRTSLALDLMEELRPCMADRFVLTLVNNRVVGNSDFDIRENGAVFLNDTGRRTFLKHWQTRKQEILTHPYLHEKLPWGLVPYIRSASSGLAVFGMIWMPIRLFVEVRFWNAGLDYL